MKCQRCGSDDKEVGKLTNGLCFRCMASWIRSDGAEFFTGFTFTSVTNAVLVSVAVLLLLMAGAVWPLPVEYSATSLYGNRFKDDVAMGATANAVEFMAKHQGHTAAGDLAIAGLLMIVISQLRTLNTRKS